MRNISKRSTTIYQLVIFILSIVGLFAVVAEFGAASWRLFPTWILIAMSLYFLILILTNVFDKKHEYGFIHRPMFLGVMLMSLLTSSITTLVAMIAGWDHAAVGGVFAIVIYIILPVLVLIDYILFTKKGELKMIDPFYFVALPATYIATMLFSAEMMPAAAELRYPLALFNYANTSMLDLVWVLGVYALLILGAGFVFVAVDIVSGEKE